MSLKSAAERHYADPADVPSDIWSEWLLHRRHGDDPEYDHVVRGEIESVADRVLDGARLAPGMTLADVGSGDGLIAFRAIDRIGPTLRVLLTDISVPLLRHAESLATQRGVAGQCSFLQGAADDLAGIGTASVDAVTTRAVLAYVADKVAALRAFRRILKPGGRLSIAEPVFRDEALVVSALKAMIDACAPGERQPFHVLMHRWKSAQFPDTPEKIAASPIANYTERDLVRFAEAAGFTDIHMEFHIDVTSTAPTTWETFLATSPHPLAPPLGAILAERFTPEERRTFEEIARPMVCNANGAATSRLAYLTARKRPD